MSRSLLDWRPSRRERAAMLAAIKRQVPALEYARCPSGHASVVLDHGHDALGKFLVARCTAPGCSSRAQTFRDPRSSC